jgi:hypothetical protein
VTRDAKNPFHSEKLAMNPLPVVAGVIVVLTAGCATTNCVALRAGDANPAGAVASHAGNRATEKTAERPQPPPEAAAVRPEEQAAGEAPPAEPEAKERVIPAPPVATGFPPPKVTVVAPANEAPARTPPRATAPSAPAEKVATKGSAAPEPVKAPALDLKALEKRLKETSAIGVFTKLTLKNQVDDLLARFRAYYEGRARTTLAELRQPYDLLILKVLALLQDGDPALARTIAASREAIWGILADPVKFRSL